MLTAAAARSIVTDYGLDDVFTRGDLYALGCRSGHVAARLAAGRWQRMGTAYVTHNGPLTIEQTRRVALLNCGPRAVYAGFTAVQSHGLTGWERDNEVHILAPSGTRRPSLAGIDLRLHRTAALDDEDVLRIQRRQKMAPAAVLAASSFGQARPAVGLLAAAVQQRLSNVDDLRAVVLASPRVRHRAAMLAAIGDIEMGAHAHSEIDFARLCRHANFPEPTRQAVRVDSDGRRRYLDVEWKLPDGRILVVEVDGALHLAAKRWFDDQLRQNELTLSGSLVLRYPSVIVRTEEPLVVAQLARILPRF